jgi:two-component sensor histidine kinase
MRDTTAIGFSLEFLTEPAMLVDLKGRIHNANAAAHHFWTSGRGNPTLFDFIVTPKSEVETYLRRASGSSSPHIGALKLRTEGHVEQYRAFGARVPAPAYDQTMVVLRLLPAENDRFSVLDRRARQIDRELRERIKENALLAEALEEKRVLVRELQHRVKNNIQQMLSLINFAAADRQTPEVDELVSSAAGRLRAMAATQEAIYQTRGAATLGSEMFLREVAHGVAKGFGAFDRLSLSIDPTPIPAEVAHNVALIANELTTNAFKYGKGRVTLQFQADETSNFLEVHDEGPGFDEETLKRASGLKLVRSLCRQIEGKLHISNDGGCKCTVQFGAEPS